MATTVAKPKAPKVPKEKKAAVAKKPRAHPPYADMIKEAIASLKERTGSSQYAITKFIEDKQKDLSPFFKKHISLQLKKLVASGTLTKVKSSFKLSAPVKTTPVVVKKAEVEKKKKAVVAKPKKAVVAVKPKKAAVSATKKKSVVKPKAKAVEKPKAKVVKAKASALGKRKAVEKAAAPVKKAVKKVKSLKSPVKKGKK